MTVPALGIARVDGPQSCRVGRNPATLHWMILSQQENPRDYLLLQL